jgi:spore maturation protein CgeB
MTNILILGNMSDMQTGIYVMKAFAKKASNVIAIDTRKIVMEKGIMEGQQFIKEEIDEVELFPSIILIMKGMEISYDTLEYLKSKFPDSVYINWFFDVYFGDKPIWENTTAFNFIKFFDYFYCSLKGVADKMQEVGLKNAEWLPEAACDIYNKPVYLNYYQQEFFGADVSFAGTIGNSLMHKKRIEILKHLSEEGYYLKIWGDIVGDKKFIPSELFKHHQNYKVINDKHSMVAQASLINLGIDQDNSIELSQSARMYRVMLAGGLYLTGAVKGLDQMFKINKEGEPISPDQDLVVYYSNEDLVEKIDYLLDNEELRNSIRLNGQKKVKENHIFNERINDLMRLIK